MLGVILPGSKKLSRYTITGGDVVALAARLAEWRKKAELAGKPVRILSCYEAGFDGHWLHRWLTDQGVINHEIDPSSIEVNRRGRGAPRPTGSIWERMMTGFPWPFCGASRRPAMWSMCRVWKMKIASWRSRARERLLK